MPEDGTLGRPTPARRVVLSLARAASLLAVIIGIAAVLSPGERSAGFYVTAVAVALAVVIAADFARTGRKRDTRITELERALESERSVRVQAEAQARDLQHDLEKTRTARERAERHAGKAGARIEDFEKMLEEANRKIDELGKDK